MSDTFHAPAVTTAVPVQLPPVAWIGNHPTIAENEPRGTRLRRCLRCDLRSDFHALSCEPGMVVHLIDVADVAEAPEAFRGSPWATPNAIAAAHEHWRSKGYTVVRKPDGAVGERDHPRYRPCSRCTEEAMAAGSLTPLHLTAPVAPERHRGGRRA